MTAAVGLIELRGNPMPITIDISQSPTLKRLYDEAEREGKHAGATDFCIKYSQRQGYSVSPSERDAIKAFSGAQCDTFMDAIVDTNDFEGALGAASAAP